MAPRLDLQALLETLLGSEYVYYQAPPNTEMQYPCIVYALTSQKTVFADNSAYSGVMQYQVTIIDADPDSPIPGQVGLLPMCLFTTRFVANDFYHSVYKLYY